MYLPMHKLYENVSCSLLSWQTTQYFLTLTTSPATALHACIQWTNAGHKMFHGSFEQQHHDLFVSFENRSRPRQHLRRYRPASATSQGQLLLVVIQHQVAAISPAQSCMCSSPVLRIAAHFACKTLGKVGMYVTLYLLLSAGDIRPTNTMLGTTYYGQKVQII